MPPAPAAVRAASALTVHSLVFCGGVAALSWELVWQLQATLACGVSAVGTALVLAATMGGMTVGALAAGAWLRGRGVEHPLRAYGWLELVIGANGLLLLPGFAALEALDAYVYGVAPASAPWLQGVGVALLVGPATTAMGASVPLFQLVARSHATRISILYATNTVGAAGGVLLITFALLPALGVLRTCLLVASLNLAVFATTRVSASAPATGEAAPAAGTDRSRRVSLGAAQVLVFVTGLATFGLEVAWFRMLRAAFWSTSATFAILLAAVLVPLAVGARAVPALRRRGVGPAAPLAVAGTAILLATPLIERMDRVVWIDGAHGFVLAQWFALTLATVGPAVACLATALPWCLEEYPETAATGRLYGLNTLGSVAGALLAAWVLLPAVGFARSAWLLAVLVLAAAAWVGAPRLRAATAIAGAAALVLAATFSSSPGRDRLYGDQTRGRILAHREGPDFTTSVKRSGSGVHYLLIDGFSASGEDALGAYMEWMGSLPALLHPRPERGLVICFGTGRTANALRKEGLAALDIVDVSRAVFDLAPHFAKNEGVLDDPRVRAIAMDGRAWLRRSRERYDVVTLEPMPPNFAGVNALYSREFYATLVERLAPGGVAAQWLPIHLLSTDHAASVAATFRAAFPDSIVWLDPVGATGILLGRATPGEEPLGASWPGLERASHDRELSADELARSTLLGSEAFGRYADGATLVTDDNQLLQFGQLRPGLRGRLAARYSRENLEILSEVAGREAYRRSAREGPARARRRSNGAGSR